MHWDCCQTVHVGCGSWGKENFEDNGHKSYAYAPCITQKTKNTHHVSRMWNYNQLNVNPNKTTYKICHINPPYNYISNIYCTSHVTYMSHVCAIRSQSMSHKCITSYIYIYICVCINIYIYIYIYIYIHKYITNTQVSHICNRYIVLVREKRNLMTSPLL